MFAVSVSSIVRRSTPSPQPPVGGNPYSSALAERLVDHLRLVVARVLLLGLIGEALRCTIGSFSSVYALQSSRLFTKSSKRSVMSGGPVVLRQGAHDFGWSMMNPGFQALGLEVVPDESVQEPRGRVRGEHSTRGGRRCP